VVYTTFLLDLTSQGSVQHVPGSLKYRPDKSTVPKNAFAWKITVDSNGVVAIRALRDQKLVVIAHGKYATKLTDRKQNGSEPTPQQWWAVNEAIGLAMHQAQNHEIPDEEFSEPIEPRDLHQMKDAGPSYAQQIAREKKEDRRRRGLADRDPRDDDPEWRGWQRKRPDGKKVLIGLAVVIVASIGVYFAVGRSARTQRAAATSSPAPAPEPAVAPTPEPAIAPPPAPEPTEPMPSTAGPTSLAQAIITNPNYDVEKLANYKVRWTDVDVPARTTLGKVEKDPTAERGKPLCVDGTIDRIVKKDVGGRPHFEGALITKEGDRVFFLAGGSTGELVKRDAAKLCGIVIGTIDSSTSVFGMFDLPENRNPVLEAP
jgi:hypothetical protein